MGKAATSRNVAEPAEIQGLIWGYRFDDDGSATALDIDAARLSLGERHSWVWLHFDLGDQRARQILPSLPNIPEDALAILMGTDERPHIDALDGGVIAGVAVDFERSESIDPRRMVTWRFCMLPHVFISARRQPLQTMQQLHFDVMSGRRFDGVLQLFDGIVHSFISAMVSVQAGLSERLDAVEDALLDTNEVGDFEELGQVRRGAVRLYRQTQPLQAMLHHVLKERPSWFTDDAADDCEHVAGRIHSVAADLTALQERARSLQDEMASRQNEQTNQRLMLISVITALMLPPTVISGVFGMNVEGLPWKDNPLAFIYTMILMGVTLIVVMFALRKMKLL